MIKSRQSPSTLTTQGEGRQARNVVIYLVKVRLPVKGTPGIRMKGKEKRTASRKRLKFCKGDTEHLMTLGTEGREGRDTSIMYARDSAKGTRGV